MTQPNTDPVLECIRKQNEVNRNFRDEVDDVDVTQFIPGLKEHFGSAAFSCDRCGCVVPDAGVVALIEDWERQKKEIALLKAREVLDEVVAERRRQHILGGPEIGR